MKTLRKSFCAIIILCMVALTTSCNSLLNLLEQGITYVDDFGRVCYHKFQDYFDDIFLTSKRDIVNKKMYLAISILNKSEQ